MKRIGEEDIVRIAEFPGVMERCAALFCLLLVCLLLPGHVSAFGVVDTKHNLAASGLGTLTATEEKRVCIFCHTPHHANVVGDYMPLWSRQLSTAVYQPYTSTTIQAAPGQPTGSSRLCLSCHDGTIALGMLNSNFRPGGNTLGPMPLGATNLETDLSDDHPISFDYDETLALTAELHSPSSLPNDIRLENGRLECIACHDAHLDLFGKFLVMDNLDSALCESCHDKTGWAFSSHHPPNAKCESCHTSHSAGSSAGLLLGGTEEDTCYLACHNGVGPGADVKSAFSSVYFHPIDVFSGVHDPVEDPAGMSYHVECVDCHNGHMANGSVASAPLASGVLAGVSGINATGSEVENVQFEYEVCYKCHSGNVFGSQTAISRQFDELDQRLRFDAGNPSYHPVTAGGKNSSVPSLRPEYTVASRIYCSDCHNNSNGTKAGGAGANGVHGSIYPQMLIAQYETNYPAPYVESNYELCWRCHDPNILLAGGTFHIRHVQGHESPCSACHDPHGAPASAGATTTTSAYLINFDVDVVGPTMVHDSVNRSCTVDCHTSPATKYYLP